MKKFLTTIILSISVLYGCGQFSNEAVFSSENIDRLIDEGQYKSAEEIIKIKIATGSLSKEEIYDLNFKIDRMNRIRKDFSNTDSTVIAYIKERYPEVTPEELAKWEAEGALECKMIDGEKRYFWNAGRNLFRISKEAQSKQKGIQGRQSDELDIFLGEYLPKVTKAAGTGYNKEGKAVMPVTMKLRYTITVPAGEVPEGEMIRVWMPYPRNNEKHTNIKLLSTTQPEYIISPESYVHKSIYMEKPAQKDSATVFGYELSYTSYNKWFKFDPLKDLKPYDKESELYKKYTSERETHVIFTEDIKRITDSIVGNEQNPYLKSVKIFYYIGKNYPWASAREYSTIENIPQYVIDNKHGDCGQVGLLFITMARYAGIPAKWQSGWMLHPGDVNLHDWAEAYYEGIGWVPVDQSFGHVYDQAYMKDAANEEEGRKAAEANDDVYHFYTRGLDAYRYIVNDDYSGDFFPAKIHPRSETVDFQRGEVEWKGENLYFGRWKYKMEVLEYKY